MKGMFRIDPRWLKVWADLWGNKLRTTLVVLSISVGVFAVGMVYSSYLMFERDLSLSWKSASPASASVYSDPFEPEMIDTVRSLRGIKEADGRRNVDLRVYTSTGEWKQMFLTALPDYTRQKVNVIRPQTGDWPPKEGDVLIERSSLADLKTAEGREITVETATGKKRKLQVTGVVYDPSQVPSMFSGRSYGYISMDTLEKLEELRRLDQVNFLVQPGVLQGTATAPIEKIGRKVWNKLEQADTLVYWLQVNKPGEHPMQGAINALILLLTILGILSLCLSSFLLINTVSAILTQQIRQIGIMKAVGAQRQQILEMYLILVAAFGILSLIIAAPLGALAASGITMFIASVFNFDSGSLELPLRVLLLEAGVSILIPAIAAFWPIWQGTSVTVREAISDYGISSTAARGRLDLIVDAVLSRLKNVSRPLVLSLRNTFRRKTRLMLTLLTLTVAGTVFMAVFSVRASLYQTLDQALDYFNYDISLGYTESYRASRISQEVLAVPGVKTVEAWGYSSGRILLNESKQAENEASKNTFILAPPVDTHMIRPQLVEGRWLKKEDENGVVINTEVLKDNPQLGLGKQAVVKIGNRKIKMIVVGIVQGILTGPIMYAPYEWFTGAVQEAGKARSVQVLAASADPKAQSDLGRALEQHMKKHGLKVQNVDITWEQKQRIRAQFDILTLFLLLMATLLAVVGALGLMGAMGINVLERTREIGVMRAIGASSVSIGKIFVVEALCIGLLSWLIGAIMALPIAVALGYQVGMLFMQSPLKFSFSFLGVGIWLVLAVCLSVAASLLPAWNAAKMSVRDVLSYE